jgi:hypothetical protein
MRVVRLVVLCFRRFIEGLLPAVCLSGCRVSVCQCGCKLYQPKEVTSITGTMGAAVHFMSAEKKGDLLVRNGDFLANSTITCRETLSCRCG